MISNGLVHLRGLPTESNESEDSGVQHITVQHFTLKLNVKQMKKKSAESKNDH